MRNYSCKPKRHFFFHVFPYSYFVFPIGLFKHKKMHNMNDVEELKLCVIGCTGVGKSMIVFRFIQNCFIKYFDPTIQDWYLKVVTVDGIQCKLDILDMAPQHYIEFTASNNPFPYQGMIDSNIRRCQAFLAVFDLT